MLYSHEITGVILAGGKSSRFGCNKALSDYNGATFLQQIAGRLRPFVKEVVIAGFRPEYAEYKDAGIPILADKIEGIGPLGGIYTALEYSRTPWILVMTCDMPLVSNEIIARMMAVTDENVTGWEQDKSGESGGVFPLLISRKAIPRVEEIIANGRYSVKQLFEGGHSKLMTIPDELRRSFVNINNQEEYQNLLANKNELPTLP